MRVIFIVGKCPKYFEADERNGILQVTHALPCWANLRQELDHVFGCWMRDIYLGTPENEL